MSRYTDAIDAGYDGPSPFNERRKAAQKRKNDALDCRDPDHDPCEFCTDNDEDDENEH
jgi:hypothetical protein